MGKERYYDCCQCPAGGYIPSLYAACIECHHRRCHNCPVSERSIPPPRAQRLLSWIADSEHQDPTSGLKDTLSKDATSRLESSNRESRQDAKRDETPVEPRDLSQSFLKTTYGTMSNHTRELEIRYHRILTVPELSQTELFAPEHTSFQAERVGSDFGAPLGKSMPISTPNEDIGQDRELHALSSSIDDVHDINNPFRKDHNFQPVHESLSTPMTEDESSMNTLSDVEDSTSEEFPSISPLKRPREKLLYYLMQSICPWLHRYLRQKQNGSSTEINENTGSSKHSLNSSAQNSTSNDNRQRREHQSGNASDSSRSDGERQRKRRRKTNTKSADGSPGMKFACPYYKRQPHIYQTSRGCAGPGWDEVHRVKGHLYKCHLLIRCDRCGKEFKDKDCLLQHTRAPERCSIQDPLKVTDRIDDVKLEKLRSRSTLSKLTEKEKWIKTYRIIFPWDDPEKIPSPYHDNEIRVFDAGEYQRQELLTELEQAFRNAIAEEFSPFESRLQQRISDVMQSVIGGFRQRRRDSQHHEQISTSHYIGVSDDADLSDELQPQGQDHSQQEHFQLQHTDTERQVDTETLQDDEGFETSMQSSSSTLTSNLDRLLDLSGFFTNYTPFNLPSTSHLLSGSEAQELASHVNSDVQLDLPSDGTQWEVRRSDLTSLLWGELPAFDGGSSLDEIEGNCTQSSSDNTDNPRFGSSREGNG